MKNVLYSALAGALLWIAAGCGGQSEKTPAAGSNRDSASSAGTDSMVNNSAGEPRILDTTKRGDSALKK
ncbi:hypothetical protein [Deminuibacter soli]|uniref:Uncharacterized protein n=1 Tax=Deminuibacter soli TaxID=2291815 RepID=A0A3E1NH35_9BACT|nr:hypothetical protein [Deminuibacter soli]RFM27164.1 hypothetical protein DXN05_17035 [Deminuibacter soli]